MPRHSAFRALVGPGSFSTPKITASISLRLLIKIPLFVSDDYLTLNYIISWLVRRLAPHVPLFGVDMWEHAFYLQYKNVKPDVSPCKPSSEYEIEFSLQYLNAIWHVINFEEAENRLKEANPKL